MSRPATPHKFDGEVPDVEVRAMFDNPHACVLGFHLTEYLWHDILTNTSASSYVLITDTNVAALYLADHKAAFSQCVARARLRSKSGETPRLLVYTLPPGEASKSRDTKARIEDYMLVESCNRDSCIVALGGGVVGDLAGYVAATFMRGISIYHIPTTLLAMVSSSIGGNTAINLSYGKNLLGAFWPPRRVYADLAVLGTLPAREFSAGMAEVIKHGVVASAECFELLESPTNEFCRAVMVTGAPKKAHQDLDEHAKHIGRTRATRTVEQDLLLRMVADAARVKLDIVAMDERDAGLRGLLNFGHTIGHALETLLSPALLHGECVAIGMVLEAEVARSLGHLDQVSIDRLVRCLRAYDLPVSLKDSRVKTLIGGRPCYVDDMMRLMKVDKKNIGSTKRMVLLDRIGNTVEQQASAVADHVIEKVLCDAVQVLPDRLPGFAGKEYLEVRIAGCRSILNRVLLAAALGTGTCRIRNLSHSNDTHAMLFALKKLNSCAFGWEDDGSTLVVTGGGGRLYAPATDLEFGSATTAMRFLTTTCTLAEPHPDRPFVVLRGNARMNQQLIGPLVAALVENGNKIKFLEREGYPPLRVSRGFRGGHIQVAGSMTSRYVSSILLCAPYAKHEVTLELVGDRVVSQPYIDMTIAVMRSFGIAVERVADNVYHVPQGCYVCPPEYVVESDASSATYPLAIAAITGTAVTIPSIGSASIQEDASFAVDVLRPMGCEVVQTETCTMVRGCTPSTLRPLPLIDMKHFSVAFMATAMLAAVATGQSKPGATEHVTKIVGIANQRVKDYDRIRTMVDELTRFGVRVAELLDGLEITGTELANIKAPQHGVHCHGDHRIAMSFSVLGCVVPGVVIQERRCVEKTWPAYWDMLETVLGFRSVGVDMERARRHTEAGTPSDFSQVIILVGMRMVGKTVLGRVAASTLGLQFIDLELLLENTEGQPSSTIISTHGWAHFRQLELRYLHSCLETCQSRAIIAASGGMIELAESHQFFESFRARGGTIVFIKRDLKDIALALSANTTYPAYQDSLQEMYARREPLYRDVSSYEFYNTAPVADNDVTSMEQELGGWVTTHHVFNCFIRFLLGDNYNQLSDKCLRNSFFICLAVPDVREVLDIVPRVLDGIDAVELRVDHLANLWRGEHIDYDRLHVQLMLLRQVTPLPVIFTVRTQNQGGLFPDDRVDEMFILLEKAIRWGCEYVDVEVVWDAHHENRLVTIRGNTQLIASWHDPSGTACWDSPEMREIYERAARVGNIVRLVNTAKSFQDNILMQQFVKSLPSHPPVISLNMGAAGQSSRMLNHCLNPVTHAALPISAGPGQLTMAEVHQGRHLSGLLPSRSFYLFGTPISPSILPLMHNTGFRELNLPYHYHPHETSATDSVGDVIRAPDFGGASVTIPRKRTMIPLLDELTEHARALGAVDTVIPVPEGLVDSTARIKLVGENTEWKAVVRCIQEVRASQHPHNMVETALVLGAGEAARAALYALQHLKVPEIYLMNRSMARAHELVQSLQKNSRMQVLTTLTDPKTNQVSKMPSIIISTVPSHALTITSTRKSSLSTSPHSLLQQQADTLHVPEEILSWRGRHSSGTMVVIDMAHVPRRTALLRKAEAYGWSIVDSMSLQLAQGFEQFQLLTGRRAPVAAITEAVAASDPSTSST